ncbi:MAG TPA: hypothetical protein VEH84_17005 [Alphaproteobacteria bacterium]|nr:hypothetical protein [Alphaproteobacteria bacterium]
MTLNVTAQNDAPTVTGLSGATFNENTVNAAAQLIDTDITLADVDSADFDGGTLSVTYSVGGGAQDQLGIRNQGTAAGQIGVSGSSVTYGGVTIGTITATGANGGALTVSLNANATPAAVEALIENLTYANTSDTPTASRTISITVSDGDGGTSTAATAAIAVTAQNDAPTLTGLDNASFSVGDFATGSKLIDTAVVFSDPDGVALDGGTVTIGFTSGGATTDSLTIGESGTGTGTVSFNGTQVSFGGQVFGTVSGGTSGTDLQISLNGNATVAAVDALLQSIAYRSTAVTPAASRTVAFTVTDGAGGSTGAVSATIGISGAGNADPVIANTTAGQAVNDSGTVSPFSGVTLSDADSGTTLSVTVSLDDTAKGAFTSASLTSSGFTAESNGTYTFSGTVAAAQAALRALVFDPANDRKAVGSSETTTFTIAISDGSGGTDSDNVTTVVSTSVNDAPTLGGITSTTTINDTATATPFSSVTIADSDPSQTVTVTVTLDAAAKGALSGTSGTYDSKLGEWSFSGSAAAAQAAIRALSFNPTDNRVAPGSTETTTFTISVDDGVATAVTDGKTTVTSTSVNDAPTVTDTVASQAVNDSGTVSPFSGVTLSDVDPDTTLSVTVSLDDTAKGAFTSASLTSSGFTAESNGTYTFSGTVSAAQAALRALVFDPANDRKAVGSSETTTFTIAISDGSGGTDSDNVTTVVSTSVNDAPTITDPVADQQVNDSGTVNPFSGVTLSDLDPGTTLSVTVSLDDTAKGAFTSASLTSSGFTAESNGTYTYSGTVAAAQAALRALVFDPANDRKAVGSSETTTFTIAISDGSGGTDSDNVTTVVSTSVNDAPTLGGITATTTINDTATATPFSSVTIADSDPSQTVTVTVTLDSAAKGVLPDGKGSYDSKLGVWTFTGSAADAQAAIRALSFNPTDNRVAPGSTETTTFTISVDDGVATAVTDGKTTVISTSVNDAPTITDTVADQQVNDSGTVNPFSGVTLADVDPNTTLSVIVLLDDTAKGAFTSASLASSGFTVEGDGTYTFSGSVAAAQSALRALVFDPANNRKAVDGTETTTFTIAISDGSGGSDNDKVTTVISKSVNDAPTLGGITSTTTINDTATATPFSAVTIADSDPSQTVTVKVTLDAAAKGALSGTGGTYDSKLGEWTFTGSATDAQAAIRALSFNPTDNRVAPGSTETTTFTISVDDGVATAVTDGKTTVTSTSVNDAPTIADTVADQQVNDSGTVSPFSGVTLSDVDPDTTLSVTVSLDDTTKGAFTSASLTSSGFTAESNGTYTYSGTVAAAQAALRALVFDPANDRKAVGSTETTTFTIAISDGSGGTDSDNVTTVVSKSVNDAPTLGGITATTTINDTATATPFSSVTIADSDPGQTVTVKVTLDSAAKGVLPDGKGSYDSKAGVWTFTGSAADAQAAIRALSFNPTDNRVAPGSTETTTFTISVDDGVATAVTDGKTTVTSTSVNDAPVIAGTVADQAASDTGTVSPFAAVTLTDADPGATLSVTVSLDDAAKGVFTSASLTSSGFTAAGQGKYTFTGSAADAQAALRALVFDPTNDRVGVGQTETATFTIGVDDGDGGTDSDDTTSLVVNSDNSVPTLNLGGNGGGNTGVQIADVATVTPFTGATIADSDPGQSITVTVTLDDVAKGTLGGGGGSFDPSTGVWTFTGSAAAAEAALRALVFTPTPNRIAVGQTEAAGFTVAVSDGQADPVTATTTVNVLSINDAPSIVDTVAGQTVSDQGTIRPFTTTVIGDPDQPDQILQLTITLDDPAKGVFTDASLQASGFGTQASGLRRAGADALVRAGFVLTDAGYTRSGTSAELTAAVRALVFDPTDNRVAVGLTETTVFTLTVRDPSDGSAEDGTTSVVVLSLNDAPTVAGTVAGQTVLDNATLAPFAGATIGDADRPNQTLTLTVAQNDPALGQITSASLAAAGFTSGANGAFTRTGTAAELTAAIRQLVFDPVENRVAPGTTETAAFTLTVTDSEGATTTDATTTVTIRSANDGPMLGGLVAVPTLVATATTTPFAGATIADVDAGQTMTVTVRLDDNAKGVLTNLGGFVFSNGAYTMTGSAAAVQAALRGLVFDPADGRMAFGARETTAFTVTVSDGMASATGTVSVNAAMPEAPPPPAPPAPPPPPPPPPAPPPLPPAPTLIVTTAVPAVVAPPAPVTVGPANDAITAPPSLTRAVADLPSTLNAPTDQGADAGRNPVRSSGDGAGGRTAGLEVVGRVGNATVEVGEPLTLQVPRSVFRAADPQQTLVFEARKADGSPLPAWIKFDPATGTFSGRPPPGEEGLKLVVIARDTEGNEAATEFEIKVEQGGEPRPAGAQPPLSGEPAPQAEDGAAPAPRADAGQPADTAVAAGLAGRASLTAQLAAAGRDGGAEADSLLASLARLFFAEEAPAEAPSTEDLPQPRDEAA